MLKLQNVPHSTFKWVLFLFGSIYSLNCMAETSLDLSLPVENKPIFLALNEAGENSNSEDSVIHLDDQEKKNKAIWPIIVSASFLAMSLYGDNEDSGGYRAIGGIATIGSLIWYFD